MRSHDSPFPHCAPPPPPPPHSSRPPPQTNLKSQTTPSTRTHPMGISSMPAPKESLLIYLLYHAVASFAALTSLLRATLVFLGLPAPLLAGDDGEGADQLTPSVVSVSGPTLAEIFRSRFRPARFGRRNRGHGGADCRVCLVRFEADAVVNRLPCGHVFHRACLETWLDYDHATCPLCRSRLLPAADEPRSTPPAPVPAALI